MRGEECQAGLSRCRDGVRSNPRVLDEPDSTPAFEVFYDMKTMWPAASLQRLAAIMPMADSGA
jgi:hypothetical protein